MELEALRRKNRVFSSWNERAELESFFRHVNGVNLFFRKGNYSLDIAKCTVVNVEKAAEIINNELNEVDTIKALANRVGLNQNSLQNGLQHFYGTSVNSYIRNTGMEMGKNLMEKTEWNISGIAISSRSYFSKGDMPWPRHSIGKKAMRKTTKTTTLPKFSFFTFFKTAIRPKVLTKVS